MNQFIASLCAFVALAAMLGAGSAIAQGLTNGELKDTKGSVMVLKGKDYVSGVSGMTLASGDRILVLEKAQTTIAFDSAGAHCDIHLKENQSITLTHGDCATQTAAVSTLAGAAVAGSAALIAGTSAGVGVAAASALVVGGAAIGGIYAGSRTKASSD